MNPAFSITNEMTHALTKIERARGFLDAATLSPGDVPDIMRDLVKWLNAPGDIHPVLASGIAQFQLVHIHPFVDGNGRTSRLLSTLCLYRIGYDFKQLFLISEFYDRNRLAFYKANTMNFRQTSDINCDKLPTRIATASRQYSRHVRASLRQQLAPTCATTYDTPASDLKGQKGLKRPKPDVSAVPFAPSLEPAA